MYGLNINLFLLHIISFAFISRFINRDITKRVFLLTELAIERCYAHRKDIYFQNRKKCSKFVNNFQTTYCIIWPCMVDLKAESNTIYLYMNITLTWLHWLSNLTKYQHEKVEKNVPTPKGLSRDTLHLWVHPYIIHITYE